MPKDGSEGTLTDAEIIARATQGELIASGFEPANVKQACYELRTSSTYYDLASPDRPIVLKKPAETILIKPKQSVVVITEESLELSDDVLGRVLSKGQLFSLGVVPVNTYADPGFQGRLGIVLTNISNDYLALPQGEPVAKLEFVRLRRSVKQPYRGQHGYETRIWPIKHQFKLTPEQIADDPRIGDDLDEMRLAFGQRFASLAERIFKYERRLIASAGLYMVLMLGVVALNFSREDRISVWASVGLGVVSSFIYALITFLAASAPRIRWR